MKIAFISDIHIPFHHTKALNLTLQILKDLKPNTIILGGDIIDFYLASSFTIDKTQFPITKEIEETKETLLKFKKICKNIIYLIGNHEERLIKFILKKADTLAPLLNYQLSIENLLELNKIGITFKDKPFYIEKLLIMHGHEIKTSSQLVHIALTIFRKIMRPIIMGHWHTFQIFFIKEVDKTIKASYTSGCLFDINKMPTPYTKFDTQILGFSLIHLKPPYFHIDPIIFIPQNNKNNKILTFYHKTPPQFIKI